VKLDRKAAGCDDARQIRRDGHLAGQRPRAPNWRMPGSFLAAHQPPKTRGNTAPLANTGKAECGWKRMVAAAVTVEPVSALKFPANRENNGDFSNFGPLCGS